MEGPSLNYVNIYYSDQDNEAKICYVLIGLTNVRPQISWKFTVLL